MVIWDKVFKNGQSGFADNRTWSILKYFVPCIINKPGSIVDASKVTPK